MANFVPVRPDQHKDLKISSKRDLSHIEGQHIVAITATEYSQSSTSFPIMFVKSPDSERYRSVVMLGLEAGENLFYRDNKWSGLSVPQSIGLIPFSLGIDPDKENTLTACIDTESAFVGTDKDLPLFDAEGKETEILTNVQQSLGRLYEQERMTENFIKELVDNDLLQELELNISLNTGEKKKLVGIYTINENKLKNLSDEKVLDFNKRGLFIPIHAMLGSIGQINRLVQLRNDSANEIKVTGIQIVPLNVEDDKK